MVAMGPGGEHRFQILHMGGHGADVRKEPRKGIETVSEHTCSKSNNKTRDEQRRTSPDSPPRPHATWVQEPTAKARTTVDQLGRNVAYVAYMLGRVVGERKVSLLQQCHAKQIDNRDACQILLPVSVVQRNTALHGITSEPSGRGVILPLEKADSCWVGKPPV